MDKITDEELLKYLVQASERQKGSKGAAVVGNGEEENHAFYDSEIMQDLLTKAKQAAAERSEMENDAPEMEAPVAIGENGGNYDITVDDIPDEYYAMMSDDEWDALDAAEDKANKKALQQKLRDKRRKIDAQRLREEQDAKFYAHQKELQKEIDERAKRVYTSDPTKVSSSEIANSSTAPEAVPPSAPAHEAEHYTQPAVEAYEAQREMEERAAQKRRDLLDRSREEAERARAEERKAHTAQVVEDARTRQAESVGYRAKNAHLDMSSGASGYQKDDGKNPSAGENMASQPSAECQPATKWSTSETKNPSAHIEVYRVEENNKVVIKANKTEEKHVLLNGQPINIADAAAAMGNQSKATARPSEQGATASQQPVVERRDKGQTKAGNQSNTQSGQAYIDRMDTYKGVKQHTSAAKIIRPAQFVTGMPKRMIEDTIEETGNGQVADYVRTSKEAVDAVGDIAGGMYATHKAATSAYSLKGLSKEEKDTMHALTLQRTALVGKLNKELGVSGNVAAEIKTVKNVDELLKRTDISKEARLTAMQLQQNMQDIEDGTAFLTANGRALNIAYAKDKPMLKEKYSVTDVRAMNMKQLVHLAKQENVNMNTAAIAVKKTMESANITMAALGIDARSVKAEQIGLLLKSGKIDEKTAQLLSNMVAHREKGDLLGKRIAFQQRAVGKEMRKNGVGSIKRLLKNELMKQIREGGDTNMMVIADSSDGIRTAKQALRLSKAVYDKSAFNLANKRAARAIQRKATQLAEKPKQAIAKTEFGKKVISVKTKAAENEAEKQALKLKKNDLKIAKRTSRKVEKKRNFNNLKIVEKGKGALNAVSRTAAKPLRTLANTKAGRKVTGAVKTVNKLLSGGVKALGTAGKALASIIGAAVGLLSTIIIGAVVVVIVLFLSLVIFASDNDTDVATLVDSVNTYRNEAVTQDIYESFKGETDPNGHPYGYISYDENGNVVARSNNVSSGVTWNFADGVSNDTAEIISLAAVYYQQNWPSSNAFINFFDPDSKGFFTFCKDLAQYGLDVTAKESSPYSCLVHGGHIVGYRSTGDTVTIQKWAQKTVHTEHWVWSVDGNFYATFEQIPVKLQDRASYIDIGDDTIQWVKDGTQDVTVYFPTTFPAGANHESGFDLPAAAMNSVENGGSIDAGAILNGNALLLNANVFNDVPDDWFNEPGSMSGSFSVTNTAANGQTKTDTYTVTFTNAEKVMWCDGELNDGVHGHYDINITVYMTGWDSYQDPPANDELDSVDEPGTGDLEALAHYMTDHGTLTGDTLSNIQITRTIKKLNQYGQEYTTAQSSTVGTKTVTLPTPKTQEDDETANEDIPFSTWYDATGYDADGNVEWAKAFYSTNWEENYGVSEGIKCRTTGGMIWADADIEAIVSSLGSVSDARKAVVYAGLSYEGRLGYSHDKPSGGPGNVTIGTSTDCSGFIRLCYWSAGESFNAVNTVDYKSASDLQEISTSQVLPGDLWVVDPADAGGEQGHVMMYIGSGNWIECCGSNNPAYRGVVQNASIGFMSSHPSHFYRYTGFPD